MAPTPNDTARLGYQLRHLLKLRPLTRMRAKGRSCHMGERCTPPDRSACSARRRSGRGRAHSGGHGSIWLLSISCRSTVSSTPNARRTSNGRTRRSRRRSRRFRRLAANVVSGWWAGAATATNSMACWWTQGSPSSSATQATVMCSPDGTRWKLPPLADGIRKVCARSPRRSQPGAKDPPQLTLAFSWDFLGNVLATRR